jgi:hypothetical protein
MLSLSARAGRMAMPIAYDDVSYALRGFAIYQALLEGESLAPLLQLLHEHAPLQSILSVLAHFAFGFHEWAFYAVNGLLVLALIGAVLWIVRPLGLLPQIAIALVVLCTPVTANLVAEFRPDLMWGLLCGFMAYLIFDHRFLRGSLSYQVCAAVVSALALLGKPSASPATAVFFGYVVTASFLLILREESQAAHASQGYWKRFGLFVGAVLLLIAPYYLQNIRRFYEYIHLGFVEQLDIYRTHGDFWYNLLFYTTGPVYEVALYLTFWLGVVVLLINVVRLVRCRNFPALLRYLGYATAVVAAYCAPTLSPIKTFYFGGIFYGTFLFFTVHGLVLIFVGLQAYSLTAARVTAAVLVVLSLYAFQPNPLLIRVTAQDGAERKALNEQVVDALKREVAAMPPDYAPFVYIAAPDPVTAPYLELKMGWAGRRLRPIAGYFARTPQEQFDFLERARFVLLTEAGPKVLPGEALSADLIERLSSDPSFVKIVDFADSRGQHTYLFARRSEAFERDIAVAAFQGAIARRDRDALYHLIDVTPNLEAIADSANPRFTIDDQSNLTLVAALAGMGWEKGVEMLMKRGVDLKAPGNAQGLCVAARMGHSSVSLLFLENGVTPAVLPTCSGEGTPAEVAIKHGHKALAGRLAAAGWQLGP